MHSLVPIAKDTQAEQQYLNLLRELLNLSTKRETRNDHETRSLFGRQIRFDMRDGFPLLTTKRVYWTGVVAELIWFLRGDTNIAYLQSYGVKIWDKWADANGDLGPVYGAQWRRVPGVYEGGYIPDDIDQIANLIKGLREQPHSRRHIVDSWNPSQISDMALPPCHCLYQFYVGDDGRLSLQLYQRSADIFLGVPFNIASYALLLHIVAAMIGREPGEFVHTFGDVHLYGDHIEQAELQLTRKVKDAPKLSINTALLLHNTEVDVFDRMEPADFMVLNYRPHPTIKAEARE